jgi:hypothetical protein
VHRPAELQHETDRRGIGLVRAALESIIAEVGHVCSGWWRRNLTPIEAEENRAAYLLLTIKR